MHDIVPRPASQKPHVSAQQGNSVVNPLSSQFIFATCQVGAESTIKKDLATAGWRLAFSRPGFLTFKLPELQSVSATLDAPSIFVRSWGLSLGKVTGLVSEQLAHEVWQLVGETPLDHLHVWPRDRASPGHRGFELARTDESIEAERLLCATAPLHFRNLVAATKTGELAHRNEYVLDCILVEPDQWWVGMHRVERRIQRRPGGIWLCDRPVAMVSRAYLKMCEALDWTCWPIKPGQRCVELGSAPGGASQALLERGLRVVGVDPAEIDPRIMADKNFQHLRKRGHEIKRREFSEFQWLVADMNVPPAVTLTTVGEIASHRSTHIWGIILNLKLQTWELADQLPQYMNQIRSWGYPRVRVRQLSRSGQEVCVAAFRPPRRIKRSPTRRPSRKRSQQ